MNKISFVNRITKDIQSKLDNINRYQKQMIIIQVKAT